MIEDVGTVSQANITQKDSQNIWLNLLSDSAEFSYMDSCMEGLVSSILLVSSLSKSGGSAKVFAPATVWFMFDSPAGTCSQGFAKYDSKS